MAYGKKTPSCDPLRKELKNDKVVEPVALLVLNFQVPVHGYCKDV